MRDPRTPTSISDTAVVPNVPGTGVSRVSRWNSRRSAPAMRRTLYRCCSDLMQIGLHARAEHVRRANPLAVLARALVDAADVVQRLRERRHAVELGDVPFAGV